jgi:branched-chain amino acid transport system permease protein
MINYLIAMATFGAIYAILALGLNVMWGMAGMVNLGIVGFYAFGAYISALLTVKAHAPIALGFFAAMIGTAMMAALVTLGLTRLRDDYLAIVTLGFAEVVRIVAENEIWLTKGTDGISGIPQPLKSTLGSDFNAVYLLFCLVILAIVLLVLERVRGSPFGRVLRAIRQNEMRAAFVGHPVWAVKWLTFVISAAVAGLAGGLFALAQQSAYPNVMSLHNSGFVVMMVLIGGGLVSFWGPVIGALVFILARDLLGAYTEAWLLWFGLLFMAMVLFRPEGVAGAWQTWRARRKAAR